jgi:hypothetical protein
MQPKLDKGVSINYLLNFFGTTPRDMKFLNKLEIK